MNLFGCCCVGKTTMAPNTRVTRKWELFAGRNKFYCDGLLMSAPHTGVFYLTCVLITGTSALFFAFDCPYLATKITPAIPIVGAVLYIFTMSSLLRTTFTDPGVIPRASHDEAAYIEKQIEVPNSLNSPTYRPPPRTKEVLVKGQMVKLKYCFTCKIFRPPRASHCSLCDNCVDRFDHHCPWVGNCVGKRNYRFFYMFLVSLAFLAVFIFSCSITHLVLLMKTGDEVFEVIKKAPFSVIVTAICFFSIWSVIGLAGFHTYLTTSDQTTNEDLKGSFSSKSGQRTVNPYSRGNICLNCFHILCGPMTPSLIDRRGIATDDYIQQLQQNATQLNPRIPMQDISQSMIVQQPKIDGQGETKARFYDEPTSLGVYRPQSYDNLQNGNSNSTARLVENEQVPLSHLDVIPSHSQDSSPNEHYIIQTDGSTLDNLVQKQIKDNWDDDANLTDNIDEFVDGGIDSILEKNTKKNKHNLSGSYNNLFRDNIDNSTNVDVNNSDLNNSGVCHTQLNSENSISTYNIMKSASGSENVYSNILPSSNQSGVKEESNGGSLVVDIETDPNLHLYSNIDHERENYKFAKILSQPSYQTVKSSPSNNIQSAYLESTDIMSSTLYNDDLDLDDPVQAFVNKSNNPKHKNETLDEVESHEAHRLRLLHQSTMINTALDLDSIEDTIGTSSQAAIV